MKNTFSFCVLLVLIMFTSFTYAKDTFDESEILAKRGKGVVTYESFAARVDRIPSEARYSTIRNVGRFRDIINTMLLKAQLAADAREAGFDKNKIIIDRMKLAADSELVEAWVQHYVEMQPKGDYEQLAREYYQLNEKAMYSSPGINVSHILVSTKERSIEEAKQIADSISSQLLQEPEAFDQLVEEYSDDPSASSNKGSFPAVKKGDMVKKFEDVAFSLKDGEISLPVKTNYGYHIIRLDAHITPEKTPFNEVKRTLVENERRKHEERTRRDYLSSLNSLDVEMTEESIAEMVTRQFGEDYTELKAADEKSE